MGHTGNLEVDPELVLDCYRCLDLELDLDSDTNHETQDLPLRVTDSVMDLDMPSQSLTATSKSTHSFSLSTSQFLTCRDKKEEKQNNSAHIFPTKVDISNGENQERYKLKL